MEFLVMLFIGWIIWSAVGSAAKKKASQLSPPPFFFDVTQVPPEHVRQVGGAPAAALPARLPAEESTSELIGDEAAGDRELDASGETPAELVRLDSTDVVLPTESVTVSMATLEQEVDWEAEHERFHARYVDAHSTGSAARHGLLDEMRDPAALRRAVLMAEILGPPRSLRK